jgi:hypothetical protein
VNFPEWPSVISVSVVPVVIISACGLLSLAFYGRLAALVSARNAQRTRKVGQRGPGRTSAVVGSVANTNPSGDRARPFDPQGVIALSGRRWRSDCFLPDSGCELVFPSRRLFGCGVFRCGIALDAWRRHFRVMELRESLEQVELEGRFVFHAVEPSLSDSRKDAAEIFTDTSS